MPQTSERPGAAGPGPISSQSLAGGGISASPNLPDVTHSGNDRSPHRQALDDAIAEAGHKLSLKDLTVLSEQVDPFRLDKPENHRIGKWLADTVATLGLGDRRIHNRGMHYMVLGQPKLDGTKYVSDAESWDLMERASKAARWLGYAPFDQVTDQRNAPPTIRIYEPPNPYPYLNVGIDVELPDADDIIPKLWLADFTGTQPYKIVLVGEKSSLDVVLAPIAQQYEADLYLPTGNISDTLVYQMAKNGAADGRPMVVLYFTDADPSGWNMGIEVSRKLQAFQILHFADLEFQVHRAALTPDQVRAYGDLPSSPLKPEEKRADKWRQAMGIEQTEIDALATLHPNRLRRVAREAIAPFYDADLARRVAEVRQEWLDRALEVINANLDTARLGRIRAEAADKLDQMRDQIDAINDQLRVDVDDFDLPDLPPIPQALTQGLAPEPLLDSSWSFIDQCRALIDSKAYRISGSS
jgi:hypothetical protein